LPNTLVYDKNEKVFTPENGTTIPFMWTNLMNASIQIKYFSGWKNLVTTDGNEWQDTISFQSLNSCPYQFPQVSNGTWAALDSTIVYIRTGNEPFEIDALSAGGQPITDIVGAWWQTGWEGMGTKSIQLPIIIPANQEAIIQINHIITENITFVKNINVSSVNSTNIPKNLPQLTFKEINPTKFELTVTNATQPFFIVFDENYDAQWDAFVSKGQNQLGDIVAGNGNVQESKSENMFSVQDISYLFSQPISDQYHFVVNGYANAWYINPQQLHEGASFTITLFFVPQAYYYIGVIITVIGIATATTYILQLIIKNFYGKLKYNKGVKNR